jgi:ribose-phosphate pyrophosphokinase
MPAENRIWSPKGVRPKLGDNARLRLFALHGTAELGESTARTLGQRLAALEEREFEDGEHKARPLEPVGNADVYVIQSLHGGPTESANDKLCRLLFFIGALKDAGAARVTAVVPYLCYARKDRRTKPGDPVTARYVASLFEAVGTDENLCVVSPDPGGVKRAELFREALEDALGRPVGKGFADKHRSAGVVSGDLFVGDVAGTTTLIIDDLISTGNTLLRAARAARKAGAKRVLAIVTHGLFMPGAADVIADPSIERFVVTDAVPPFRLGEGSAREKIETVATAPLLAETIRRLHEGRALTDLLVF